jgi:hypothetical protein
VRLVRAEILVHERRPLRQRLLGVDDDGQRVVLDEDLLGGVHHAVLVVADDDRDRLADVLDGAAGQRPRLRALDLHPGRHPGHRERRLEVEVVAREHAVDAGERLRALGVDRDDPGVRLRGAHDRHVEHPGEDDVVDVAPAPGDHPGVLLAAQRLADPLAARRLLPGRAHAVTPWLREASAADSTALTMLW